mgnify:CR=1 FL=1|jgi:hypothetical protein|tara:strand:- start:4079 stop:4915 length:837 start_codon:yes stop_codon:yes gene_type:complete
MPLTWFAHQVPVFGMKLARPRWFDGVALVFGSMAPDLAYAFTGALGLDGHKAPAAFTFAAPLAVVMAVLFRHVIAGQIPRCFPDLGALSVRSYGVLATRRPAVLITLLSAFLGTGSHVVMDWFTHSGQPAVRWLGYDELEVTVFGYTESLASIFQNVGHTFGSLVGLLLLVLIGRRRLLEEWYSVAQVQEARALHPSSVRSAMWACMFFGGIIGFGLGWSEGFVERVERPAVGTFVGMVIGAMLVRRFDPPATLTVTDRVDDERSSHPTRRYGGPSDG